MSLSLLHISDLHIGEKERKAIEPNNLVYKIKMALDETNSSKLDIIIVTGDIFDGSAFSNDSKANKQVITSAVSFFKLLLSELNEGRENLLSEDDIYFVPGNHEMNRNNVGTNKSIFEKYSDFLIELYNGHLPPHYCFDDWSVFKVFANNNVVLAGFNSASYYESNGKVEYYGDISAKQLNSISKKLRGVQNIENQSVIVCLHHHFYLIEERYKNHIDNSALRSSEGFLSELSKFNIKAILHGHKHAASNRRINMNYDLTGADKLTTVLGCGSSDKSDVTSNNFNYIEIYDFESIYDIRYAEYTYTNSRFNCNQSLKLPLQRTKNFRLKVEDAILDNPEIERKYSELSKVDTITQTSILYEIINETLGNLERTSKDMYDHGEVLYYILSALHYRTNLRSKDNFDESINAFFLPKAIEDFECYNALLVLIQERNVYNIYKHYKALTEKLKNQKQKMFLVYSTITVLLVEFYLTLGNEIDIFVNKTLKDKLPFAYGRSGIKKNIEGANISFEVDEDRRSLGISVVCKTAEAHKIVSLIIKEFEFIIIDFEKDFAKYGFKIYYIFPKLSTFNLGAKYELESHTFSAYIPKLIPLLAGNRIYTQPEAFARELIQNSIDAINTRIQLDPNYNKQDGVINIEIKFDNANNQHSFSITDNGTGMDQYVLERYLTTIGRSFYRSDDFLKLNTFYNPISQFGIGFLSCFMLGKHVSVVTKHFQEDSNFGFYLDIPNFDGCFFIEPLRKCDFGTTVTVFENKENPNVIFDAEKIKNYIKNIIVDIPYNLTYNNILLIKNHQLDELIRNKTKRWNLYFFIPISEFDSNLIDSHPSTSFMKTGLGIYVFKPDTTILKRGSILHILNAGIVIKNDSDYFSRFSFINSYFDVYVNLPSNHLDLDVSRDSIKNIDIPEKYIQDELLNKFKEYLCDENYRTMPMGILKIFDAKKFNFKRINCSLLDTNLFIKINQTAMFSDIINRCNVVLYLINLLFGCKFSMCTYQPDCKLDLNIFEEIAAVYGLCKCAISKSLNLTDNTNNQWELSVRKIINNWLGKKELTTTIHGKATSRYKKMVDYKSDKKNKKNDYAKIITLAMEISAKCSDTIDGSSTYSESMDGFSSISKIGDTSTKIIDDYLYGNSLDLYNTCEEMVNFLRKSLKEKENKSLEELLLGLENNKLLIDLSIASKIYDNKCNDESNDILLSVFLISTIDRLLQAKQIPFSKILYFVTLSLYSSLFFATHYSTYEQLEKGIGLKITDIIEQFST